MGLLRKDGSNCHDRLCNLGPLLLDFLKLGLIQDVILKIAALRANITFKLRSHDVKAAANGQHPIPKVGSLGFLEDVG